jgi:hypothetical protein
MHLGTLQLILVSAMLLCASGLARSLDGDMALHAMAAHPATLLALTHWHVSLSCTACSHQ